MTISLGKSLAIVVTAVGLWSAVATAGSASAQEVLVNVPSSNPLTGDPEAIEAGRKLYGTWCSQCHGGLADGVSRFGKYAADLRKFWRGYSEFASITVLGVPGKQMPPWGEVLDGEQISQVGAYLETLAIEGARWED